ncbi:MAG: hypothetical protein JW822_10705 [Spirochaetales bacterium]|nr:hypothetical protein [Spirochaetales bacterium]
MNGVCKRFVLIFSGVLAFSILIGGSVFTEETNDALACLDELSDRGHAIADASWEFVKTSAHSKNPQAVEKTREQLIKTVKKAREDAKRMTVCTEDKSLHKAYTEMLNSLFHILNQDYAKLVDMEAVSEESYDAMEAYILAKKRASEKLKKESDLFIKKLEEYAKNNNINLIIEENEITKKLKKSSQVMDYYYEIYLLFFKSYKQEAYLINSVNKENVNEIEQNRVTLLKYAHEGLNKLKSIKPFNNDGSLKESCEKALLFYKQEASEKALVYADFYLKSESFLKVKKAFELKKESDRTQADVDKYNEKVDEVNKAREAYNKVNDELNRERKKMLDKWNKTKEVFIDKHVPK